MSRHGSNKLVSPLFQAVYTLNSCWAVQYLQNHDYLVHYIILQYCETRPQNALLNKILSCFFFIFCFLLSTISIPLVSSGIVTLVDPLLLAPGLPQELGSVTLTSLTRGIIFLTDFFSNAGNLLSSRAAAPALCSAGGLNAWVDDFEPFVNDVSDLVLLIRSR